MAHAPTVTLLVLPAMEHHHVAAYHARLEDTFKIPLACFSTMNSSVRLEISPELLLKYNP